MATPNKHERITAGKAGLLFALFFLIALGLGYPVLNRYDPRQTPGLSDVRIYADMVSGSVGAQSTDGPRVNHVRFRVLVPDIAKPVYWIATGRTASWDPVMLALLVADSLFVAATCVLMVVLGVGQLENAGVGLLGAFVYLVNFAVPNLRLVGLVDASEGFFLLCLLWGLAEGELWFLPVIAALGTLAKESFIPLSIALGAAWWLEELRERVPAKQRLRPTLRKTAIWIGVSWAASVSAFIALHYAVERRFISPVRFAFALHEEHPANGYVDHVAAALGDHQFWYIFLWLLPLAIPNLKRFSGPWLRATGVACIAAFVLDAYYGGAPGTIGRVLFSIAAPTLSLSTAMLLEKIVD